MNAKDWTKVKCYFKRPVVKSLLVIPKNYNPECDFIDEIVDVVVSEGEDVEFGSRSGEEEVVIETHNDDSGGNYVEFYKITPISKVKEFINRLYFDEKLRAKKKGPRF